MSPPDLPFLREEQTWVDKRGKARQIPMKVICPGLSRTGTSSMRVALWELGYQAYHGWDLLENPPDSILWQEAMKAKFEGKGRLYTKKDFDSILFDIDAVLDVPASLFAEELIDAYPEAKVVMTTRDIDAWYSSCQATIIQYTNPTPFLIVLGYLDRAIGLFLPSMTMVLNYTYGTNFATTGKATFRGHYARVRQKILDTDREADYFEFSVKDGWEPLCRFLGKKIPTDAEGKPKPFPKVNDRETFKHTIGPYLTALFRKILWAGMAGLVLIAAIGGAWWWRTRTTFA